MLSVIVKTFSFFNSVPDALSTTLKEYFLSAALPVLYLVTVTSWTEFVTSWAYSPIVLLKPFGGAEDYATVFRNGTLCLGADPQVPVWKGNEIIGYCGVLTPILTVLYMMTHAVKNVSQVYLVKEGTAALSMAVEMIQIPLSALVFSIPVIGTEVFSWFDILGIAVVSAGFGVYAYFGKEFRRENLLAPISSHSLTDPTRSGESNQLLLNESESED